MLNKEQKNVLKILESGKNVFLTGRAGTGKSFILNYYINKCKSEGKSALITAPTGIAALNIDGVTMHSAFSIPIPAFGHYDFEIKPSQIKLALAADVIVIDEISMCRSDVFEYFYFCMKKVKEEKSTFPQIIVCGDFYQLPPVIKQDEINRLKRLGFDESGFCFTSPYWKEFKFKCIELNEVMRQNEKQFVENLDKLRRGDTSCLTYFNKKVVPDVLNDCVCICSTSAKADAINELCLNNIKGPSFIYKAKRTGFCAKEYTVDDNLLLKEGCKVVLMANDVINNKYQNGTLGKVLKCFNDFVLVELENGEKVNIGFRKWSTNKITVNSGLTNKKEVGSFSQIPLKLSYAVTMHKTQGQTFENVFISPSSFADGQLYVAVSRVKTYDGLFFDEEILPEYVKVSEKVSKFYENFEYEIDEKTIKKKKDIYKKALEKFNAKKGKNKTKKSTSKTSKTKKATTKKTTTKKANTKKVSGTTKKKTSTKTTAKKSAKKVPAKSKSTIKKKTPAKKKSVTKSVNNKVKINKKKNSTKK